MNGRAPLRVISTPLASSRSAELMRRYEKPAKSMPTNRTRSVALICRAVAALAGPKMVSAGTPT